MIIQNALKITEDGIVTYLPSVNRHHFNKYTFKDGSSVFVDGGNDYYRTGGDAKASVNAKVEDWSLDDTAKLPELKKKLLWGTYGKDGKQPLKYILLKDCEVGHLKAILKQSGLGQVYVKVIKSILTNKRKK